VFTRVAVRSTRRARTITRRASMKHDYSEDEDEDHWQMIEVIWEDLSSV